MNLYVWRRTVGAQVGDVIVTFNDRICGETRQAGGCAVLTYPLYQTGSHRIKQAAATADQNDQHDTILNVQGDFPALAPSAIAVAGEPSAERSVEIATLAGDLSDREEESAQSVVALIGSRVCSQRLPMVDFNAPATPFRKVLLYHHV